MSCPKPLGHRVQQIGFFGWILAIGSAILIIFTSLSGFALSSPTGPLAGFVRSVVSQTLAIRVITNLTKVTTIFLGALFTHTLDAIMWTAASSKDGITMPILLGLSSTTDLPGLLELLFIWNKWFSVPSSKYLRSLAVLMRLAFYVLIYVVGVALTWDTFQGQLFQFQRGVQDIGGIGYFDPSLASLFASSGELAFFFTQTFNNVLVDPRISLQVPLTNELSFCPEGATNCSAFYFPGGFEYIADNPPFFSEVSDEDVIVFKNTQGLLIGFWQLPLSDLENGINADEAVCVTYGYDAAAFEICLGPSIENDEVWIALGAVCPSEYLTKSCITNKANWQTSFTFGTVMYSSYRTSDTYYSAKNNSIIESVNILPSAQGQESIRPSDVLSSIFDIFTVDTLSNGDVDLLGVGTILVDWTVAAMPPDSGSVILLQTILTAPLLLLQPTFVNYWAPNMINIEAGSYLDVEIEYGQLITCLVIAKWTVLVFVIFSAFIYLWCVTWLVWTVKINGPPSTRFPLIDFASRVVSKGLGAGSLGKILEKTAGGDSEQVRQKLQDQTVFLGDVGFSTAEKDENQNGIATGAEVGRIGFSLNADEIIPLKSGVIYN